MKKYLPHLRIHFVNRVWKTQLFFVVAICVLIAANDFAMQQSAPAKPVVVQPGAPGKATRVLPLKQKPSYRHCPQQMCNSCKA